MPPTEHSTPTRFARAALVALAVCAAGAAIVLTVLVRLGRLAHFDQQSVYHWMPWLEPPRHADTLRRLLGIETRHDVWGTVAALSTVPAATLVSGAVVLVAAAVLWHRARRRLSVGLCDAWVLANVIELLGKHLVTRPVLRQRSFGQHGTLPGLQHSLPSGHVIRALIVATALAALARTGRIAYVWALSVPATVVAIGDHTPTDSVVGLASGIALVALVRAAAG